MPRRRCVGCGRGAPKSELVRIAVESREGPSRRRAVQDHDARMPGRGAYLCRAADGELPAADCVAQAVRRGGIARALRAAVTLDREIVESSNR